MKHSKNRTADGLPRDSKRTPRAKAQTLARKQQRAAKIRDRTGR